MPVSGCITLTSARSCSDRRSLAASSFRYLCEPVIVLLKCRNRYRQRNLLIRGVQVGCSKRQHRGKRILAGFGRRNLPSVQAAFERNTVGNMAFHPAKGALAVREEVPL